MERKFLEFISGFTPLSKEEEEFLLDCFPIRQFKKKACLMEEGVVTQDSFLILEGCIRRHRIVDGVDRTTGFFKEGDAVAEFECLSLHKPSRHSYSCVENTTVVMISTESESRFLERFPRFEFYNRMETQKMLAKNQEQLSNFITMSPEERYKHLLEEQADLLKRVPQHQIASYLGVTPESLSRIRKRLFKK